jgi:hypothetical protein
MNNNASTYNSDEPAGHVPDEDKAAEMIHILKQMFDGTSVSSRRDLTSATRLLAALEDLHINRASEAYAEINRLKAVWKKRRRAQDDIDRWMVEHGHPVY